MGVYDKIVNQISNDIFGYWKKGYIKGNHCIHFKKEYKIQDQKHRFLEFSLEALIQIKKSPSLYKFEGESYPGNSEEYSHIGVVFHVSKNKFPQIFSSISMDLKDILRHEIEHLTQSGDNQRKGKNFKNDQVLRFIINSDKHISYSAYFTLDKEVDAMLHGLYFKAKKQKIPFKKIVLQDLNRFELNKKEKQKIIFSWGNRTKALSLPQIF